VTDDYTGPSVPEGDDFTETAKKKVLQHLETRLADCSERMRLIWERASENQKFQRGGEHQWDPADWKARRETHRPTFSFKDVALAVRAVSGREITSREVATFKPRADEDDQVAAVLREWDRDRLQEANSEQVYSDAFRSLLTESYSWTQWRMKYDESPQGRMEHKALASWEMVWDPTSRGKNLLDREWDAWGGYISIDEYLMMFPDQKERLKKQSRLDKMGFGDPKQQQTSRYPWLHRSKNSLPFYNKSHREVFAIDYEWRERAPAYDVLVPPGIPPSSTSPEDLDQLIQQDQQAQAAYQRQVQEAQATGQDPSQVPAPPPLQLPDKELKRLSEADWEAFQGAYEDFLAQHPEALLAQPEGLPGMAAAQGPPQGYAALELDPAPSAMGPADGIYRWRFRRAIVVAREIVKQVEIKEGAFTRQCMTANPFKQPEGTDYDGLVDDMKDAARTKNYVTSMGVSLLQRSHKNTIVYAPGYFDDESDAEKRFAMPSAMIKGGALAAKDPDWLTKGLREFETNTYPQGMDKWLEVLDTAVWRPTGLNPQTIGSLPDARRVSGTVFSALQGAPMVVLAELFDSLRLLKKTDGRLRLAMTQAYYTPEDVKAVVGQDLAQYVPDKEHWGQLTERQIVVEVGPAGESAKEEAWDYGSRQGTWDKMVESGKMPMKTYVKMIPDKWLTQSDKQEWLAWLQEQEEAGKQPPPPKPVQVTAAFKDIAAFSPQAGQTVLEKLGDLPEQQQPPGAGNGAPPTGPGGQNG
jgi:hypothetical protein